jgi:short subunit dehydrogenase-like uncharacterized protein
LAPKGLEKRGVYPREIADKAEAAFDVVVNQGLGVKTVRIRRRNTEGRLAFGGNGRRQPLVEQAREHHDGHVASLAVRHAQAGNELALDAHALQRGGEQAPAAVDDQDFLTLFCQDGDLPSQGTDRGIVFEQSSSQLDYGSH